jgi:hypothetical protein
MGRLRWSSWLGAALLSCPPVAACSSDTAADVPAADSSTPSGFDGAIATPDARSEAAAPVVGATVLTPLDGGCLPRPLDLTSGSTTCAVLEAWNPDGSSCDCASFPARSTATGPAAAGLGLQYACVCQIAALEGALLDSCQTQALVPPPAAGWCYVDPERSGDPRGCPLVAQCPPGDKRMVRFVGAGAPRPGAKAVLACREVTFPAPQPDAAVTCP